MDTYTATFEQGWQNMMADKLGFKAFESETDDALCSELLMILQLVETDMTLFYRQLAKINCDTSISQSEHNTQAFQLLSAAYYVPEQVTPSYINRLNDWLENYRQRVQKDSTSNRDRRKHMDSVNPKYVLRNYLAQLAIDKAEESDFSLVNELLEVLRYPYDEQPDKALFAEKRPDWARQRAGCSMLSCSS